MALPTLVCLKSAYNNKFLRYRHENSIQSHGLLQFSGEKASVEFAQFEVVQAQCGDGLVHIKSRYTNKFLVRWSPNHYWITASAHQPNENKSEWSCTLFKPMIIEQGATIKTRIMHVQLSHYVALWRIGEPFDSCLFAGSKDTDRDSCDIFSVIDWSSFHTLPKIVAFKGNEGKYIGAYSYNERPCLQFSFDDPNDPRVAHEVVHSRDGTVFIKSRYYGKYWRLDKDDLVVADVNEPNNIDASEMFRVNVIDINTVALLNMSKTWYVKRYTTTGYKDLLNAATETVDRFTTLEVIDLGN